jgi:hypothetical protein
MSIRYLTHRLITNPVTKEAYTTEMGTIIQILQDNGYYNQNINATIQNKTSPNTRKQTTKNQNGYSSHTHITK